MIKLSLVLSLAIIMSDANGQKTDTAMSEIDLSKLKIAELPRPNSWTYSFEEAGKRKNEIYNLQPTQKYFGWKNPTSGGAVHINKKDEIEVYQFTFGIWQYSNDTASFRDFAVPRDTFVVIKNSKDLHHYVSGVGYGNPASVLITSEISLYKSEAIKRIMEELWKPGTQLYYLTKKE